MTGQLARATEIGCYQRLAPGPGFEDDIAQRLFLQRGEDDQIRHLEIGRRIALPAGPDDPV